MNPRSRRIRSSSVFEPVNALRIHASNGSFSTLYPKKWLRDNRTPKSLSITSIQYCLGYTLQLGPVTTVPSIPKPHSACTSCSVIETSPHVSTGIGSVQNACTEEQYNRSRGPHSRLDQIGVRAVSIKHQGQWARDARALALLPYTLIIVTHIVNIYMLKSF
ncbi:hypothetical protein M9H77_31228 [Catharanthus roseus]|uniref:Uncharacterized protein n=1 Tax=Catharanthus roseus TaxID=4058 RepID=A0ACB9ZZV0_CATRO|nr:hypothetical protein M9H77_31228 [Catharanthus roseus]